jgi:tetratricopeptide (TPR) repeat protein
MKTGKTRTKKDLKMKKTILSGWPLALSTVLAMAAPELRADRVIMKSGQVIEAKSIRFKPSAQEYSVVTLDNITTPIPAKNVEKVEVPKPAALAAAQASVAAGKYDAAIGPLDTIIAENVGLEWDNTARDFLGQAYLGKRDGKKAVSIYKEYLENVPADKVSLDVRRRYWDALKIAEMFPTLKNDLEKVIKEGSRPMAALAQMMRGEMYAAQGQKNEALLDFLRTALLYEDVKQLQPEALFKAAQLLEELRDPRAAELRKKLAQDYPNSPYAKKAGG